MRAVFWYVLALAFFAYLGASMFHTLDSELARDADRARAECARLGC